MGSLRAVATPEGGTGRVMGCVSSIGLNIKGTSCSHLLTLCVHVFGVGWGGDEGRVWWH